MLQFLIDNCVMTSILGVVLVVAAVGVVYGIVTGGGWLDRGLMVRDGVRLRWATYRIPLGLATSDVPREVDLAVADAISAFADAVGREVFVRHVRMREGAAFTDGADVVVGVGGLDVGGSAELDFDELTGEIRRVDVEIANGLSLDLIPRAVLHELGHALGLDHDESSSSVMHPTLSTRPSALSDSDRLLLRRTYG